MFECVTYISTDNIKGKRYVLFIFTFINTVIKHSSKPPYELFLNVQLFRLLYNSIYLSISTSPERQYCYKASSIHSGKPHPGISEANHCVILCSLHIASSCSNGSLWSRSQEILNLHTPYP